MIVEDGTCVEDANSYISVDDAVEILQLFGYEDMPTEADLIRASFYVDSRLSPRGSVLCKDQELLWPRTEFTDSEGRTVKGIPSVLRRAVAIIASESASGVDLSAPAPGITQQSFGDSSESYAGVYSEETQRVNNQIRLLMSLGYGSSFTSAVTIRRA